jgi:RNA polymerase sigma factor (sigma-70 family)
MSEHVAPAVDHLFRREAGRMVAVLNKLFGFAQAELADDIVQETLLTALETWKYKGLPDNPQAWLYRVAKNKALNHLRRGQHFDQNIAPNIAHALQHQQANAEVLDTFFLEQEIQDAQLRMMFACCHPALAPDVQLILMLKTLCGLSVKEIAAALLSQEDAVAKRLYRAKEKIRTEQIDLEVPVGAVLGERLDAVLKAIYLLFNEAYQSTSSDTVIRRDLCEEALRLGVLLADHPQPVPGYDLPKINALLALMCFHAARFDSRLDAAGGIILLEHQDRTNHDPVLIKKGYEFFNRSIGGPVVSEYHIEAAIASYHVKAPQFAETNWQAISYCYNLLYSIKPTPVVAFNRAIALGYADGPRAGIAALLAVEGLERNHFYHTALGDFYQKNGETGKARAAYILALQFVHLATERNIIMQKYAAVDN